MPAELDVDREAVKAHALVHGVREAARAFNLSESTVKSWSTREQWLLPQPQPDGSIVVRPLPRSIAPVASNASSPSEAARRQMHKLSQRSRLNLARAVDKGAKHSASLKGEDVLTKAKEIKALADTGDRIHQWSASQATPTLRLELIAGSQSNEPPVIDVESERL